MKNIIYILLAITLMSCKKETKLQPINNKLTFSIESNQGYSFEVYAGDKQLQPCNYFLLTKDCTVEYILRNVNQQSAEVTVKFFLDGKKVYNQRFDSVTDLCGGEFDIKLD